MIMAKLGRPVGSKHSAAALAARIESNARRRQARRDLYNMIKHLVLWMEHHFQETNFYIDLSEHRSETFKKGGTRKSLASVLDDLVRLTEESKL